MVYKVNKLPRKCYKKKKIVLLFLIIERDSLSWCGQWDLNPHEKSHTHLKRTRIPIPPWPH